MGQQSRIEDALLETAARSPGNTALVEGDRSFSYEQVAALARRVAHHLLAHGIEGGDRVAIYLGKNVESVAALYGTWLAGGVAVPINETLRSRQVEHIVRHSGSRVFVSQARMLARIDRSAAAGAKVLDLDLGGSSSERGWSPGAHDGGAAPAAILYTSGSTGRPKGILVSHDNLRAGARIVARYLELEEDERILSVLPFSFDYGLNQLLTAVDRGATLVLQRSHFPGDIHRSLARHGITGMAGVPPLWIQLLTGPSPITQKTLPHLRYITNSGGTFPKELVLHCRRALPATRLYLMYGLSEAFRSTYLPPEEVDVRPGSIGRAIPETEIFVVGEDGRECRRGEVGELVHRGPTVALGYWRDPEATAAVFRENPFAPGSGERVVYSGDLVRSDEEGFLYFVGRRDQLIKSQGYRVSPDEVEETLYASGLVSEVAVHGVPDPLAGQAIVADVVPRSWATFSEEQLLEYCRREMPSYMVPRTVRAHQKLPRTASGKLDRKGLAP